MKILKFEYVWTDGYNPTPNFRSKTKVMYFNDDYDGDLSVLPEWSFDGSSTKQANGDSSDCVLKPVRVYKDSERINAYLVLCEVFNPDGTPHISNTRSKVEDVTDLWLGFEQEYVLMQNGLPVGFPTEGFPEPQGKYYCGVGNGNVVEREMVEDHLNQCINSGIHITGVNAEVMIGQWEYQVLGKGSKKAADDLMITRYLLFRTSEKYNLKVDLHPKPVKGDWNGSGMHANFSNEEMRISGGKKLMTDICKAFGKTHDQHIKDYGSENDQRLTGLHETQHIDQFSYGVSDRGASIRIPVSVPANNWVGYLEDRRPASNADPYKVVAKIINSLELANSECLTAELV
ncbi:MAG: glutamine synthetase beta-grasp domain-containing protein [Bacteroidota bacterium]